MHITPTCQQFLASICLTVMLAACGGGGGSEGGSTGNGTTPGAPASAQVSPAESGAPQATGNTATDGFNWTNFRRQQLGLSILNRNSLIDNAAQGHSDYQKANNVITHQQNQGSPGFTGVTLQDRLAAAGYGLTRPYAFGEVISASGNTSGSNAAEDLITAIYHRFVMFEPRFREAGAGAATAAGGYTYFTLNLASTNGLGAGLGQGKFVNYPHDGQQNVLSIFYSDYETPDPVGDRNEVGYPVSVHADITSSVTVQSFTIAPRGGAPLPVKLLSRATDANTAQSAAAIVPLSVLAAKTTYDVQFSGTVDGVAASRAWSFSTR
ncbi:CAP domain-containing protein [Noviherbaspirillum sedimenti]|uniref:CAP domain-containing protein n=1 Tax=Noviherbaspirillum sedimenti TaxID=2320865 RepID=A0A3A3G888_9BURK|nr:CAP domain-containing protein [Noviherbaspirillum sedimenti]RJG02969.1 CAP domain-containing protein [Noviherbaspirillum sedimenti]